MLSRSIPNCTNADISTYGQKIGETYMRLEANQKNNQIMSNDQLYIMALTRILAHMQRDYKNITEMLESRHGVR